MNIRIIIVSILALVSISTIVHGQVEGSQSDSLFIQDEPEASPYELPTGGNLRDLIEVSYKDVLNRLNEKSDTYQAQIINTEKRKQDLLQVEGKKDINLLNQVSALIKKTKADKALLDDDIKLLKNSFASDKSDEEVSKILNQISRRHFGKDATNPLLEKRWKARKKNKKKRKKTVRKTAEGCNILFDGVDPVSLQEKIQSDWETLFTYTHPKLEAHYKDKAFITAKSSLFKLDKDYYLLLDITIRSREAIRSYGSIEKGAPIKFQLIAGDALYLHAETNAIGTPIPNSELVRYQSFYKVSKTNFKILKKELLDSLGIMWTSGYEDYSIYNVDAIARHLNCLKNY